MKKLLLYLYCVLLSLGAVLTACSNDDSESEQTTADKTFYITIKATKGNNTRALTEFDGNINATWATGENIYAMYNGSSIGTLHPEANNVTETNLNGIVTFNDLSDDESLPTKRTLTFRFPKENINYTGQNGTLPTIAANYDYASVDKEVTIGVDHNISMDNAVSFKNQQAIVKFILKKENGTDDLNVSSLRVSATNLKETNSQTGDITIVPSSATNVLYAALRDIENTQVTLTATTTNGTYYVYRKDKVTFANGTYRPITVRMRQLSNGVDLDAIDQGYIGWVVGSNGKVYANTTDVPSGETAEAMVAYVYKDESDIVHGLAIALTDENTTMSQSDANTATSVRTKIKNDDINVEYAWQLPSMDDWEKIFNGCCGAPLNNSTQINYTCLNAKLITAGGNAILANTYWSDDKNNYLYLSFDGTNVVSHPDYIEGLTKCYVRACLAF